MRKEGGKEGGSEGGRGNGAEEEGGSMHKRERADNGWREGERKKGKDRDDMQVPTNLDWRVHKVDVCVVSVFIFR